MYWSKRGIIYQPDGSKDWAKSHAMLPVPLRLNEELVRVFITCCDTRGRGRPGYIDVLANDPSKVVAVCDSPLLELGGAGTFDENGVVACSVIRMPNNQLYMYYVGFELGVNIRYRLFTGLAISDDNGHSFRKYAKVPVLDRTDEELFFRCGPWVIVDDCIHMWYVAGSDWLDVGGTAMPRYDIRYSRSVDGIHWPAEGKPQISVLFDDEFGFGRPCVISKPGGGYRMFYSIRKKSVNAYRLGYAESNDGHIWQRMDNELNLDVSTEGFDSDAIMYAAPIELNQELYLFYNGNEFGRAGVALAKLESE